MLTTRPRGTSDFLPGVIEKWQYVERKIVDICREYGYKEIRTPIFEHTELFLRGVGETTDVVQKEMYSFKDRGDRDITLRPEGTASTVRAYFEHKLYAGPQPVKLFYIGPMFRYDRPQAGRFRQFHQFGVEVFGTKDPAIDAEVITMAMDLYARLGLKDLELQINSVGCPNCRPVHRQKLQEALKPDLKKLCETCQDRFERNPMRILDCKSSICQELTQNMPTTTACLCDQCGEHFAKVKEYLDIAGISYVVNEKLVRGLDYYCSTAFEIVAKGIGAQSSIGGGGRYDGLLEEVGGQAIPGIGFALGLERIILTMENQGIDFPLKKGAEIFVAALGEAASKKAFEIITGLRKAGLSADKDYLGKGLKAQLKQADRVEANYTVIIGDEELNRGVAVVRIMAKGEQEEVPLDKLMNYFLDKRV